MARDNLAIDLLDTPTTQGHELGLVYIEPSGFWTRGEDVVGVGATGARDFGEHEWVYGRIVTDTPVQGSVIRRAGGTNTLNSMRVNDVSPLPAIRCPGVTQWAWTAGDFGFLLRRGIGGVLADAAVAVDAPIVGTGAVGRADDLAMTTAANNSAVIGLSLGAAGAPGDLFDAILNCPGS